MNGERLAKARKAAGLTQQDLADYLGLSYKAISQYERELFDPSNKNMKKMAGKLNVSLDYLFGLTDEELRLDRSNYLALPENFPEKAKKDLHDYAELLVLKYR